MYILHFLLFYKLRHYFFELHYSEIKPRIIAEEYIDSGKYELQDYKFLCFDGKPYYCWVDIDRYSNHKRNVYDMDWILQPWNQWTYGNSLVTIPVPKNYEVMKDIATKLSAGLSHVRVDLYNVAGKIYFGEMTFTNGGGFEKITPPEYDVCNAWLPSLSRDFWRHYQYSPTCLILLV